jgi:hypothetical protein
VVCRPQPDGTVERLVVPRGSFREEDLP